MKLDKLKIYLIQFVLLVLLSFALFVSNIVNRVSFSIFIFIMMIVSVIFIKKRKIGSVNSNKVTTLLVIFSIIYLIGLYLLGIFFGYYKTSYTFDFLLIFQNIIPIIIIIISSEVIRSVLSFKNDKVILVINFIIMILIDFVIFDVMNSKVTYGGFIELVCCTLFSSISFHLLYNYILNRYGIVGNIVYRLVTVLYAYVIPYVPDIHLFFKTIIGMIYPYIIYLVLEYTFSKKNNVIPRSDERKSLFGKILLGFATLTVVMLISCKFKYGLLVIGSGSMSSYLNVGDAILFEKIDNAEHVDLGDVIIFNKDDLRIVHRVIDIKNINGSNYYVTKGDANQQADEGYITINEIIGVSKFKISFIGYPSIWIRDLF